MLTPLPPTQMPSVAQTYTGIADGRSYQATTRRSVMISDREDVEEHEDECPEEARQSRAVAGDGKHDFRDGRKRDLGDEGADLHRPYPRMTASEQ